MVTITTDAAGRRKGERMRGLRTWLVLAAVALPLAGCGGSGGTVVPPITREGATLRVANNNLQTGADVVQTRGGAGPNTLYVEEGALRFLGTQTAASAGATRVFRSVDGQSVAFLTVPAGFNDIGLLRLEYQQGGVSYVSNGVFGRPTAAADMPTTGSATYVGSEAQATWIDGVGSSGDLGRGAVSLPIVRVNVDFGTRDVDATLDFRPTASAQSSPVDVIELRDMQISGSRFTGGTLTSQKNGAPVAAFSTSAPTSSGIFAGPGAAELGGVFYATFPNDGRLTGRYIAKR